RGEFDLFLKDMLWQTERQNNFLNTIEYFFDIDPLLFVLGIAGILFAAYKKDYFILLGTVPFVIFLTIIGFTQYFYFILLVPILSIAGSRVILSVIEKFGKRYFEKLFTTCAIAIVIFGVSSLIPLIMLDVSDSQFQALSFVLENTKDNSPTILASPVYSWILDDVFSRQNVPIDYSVVLFYDEKLQDIMLIADYHFMLDIQRGSQLEQLYNKSQTIQTFDNSISGYDTELYPYSSLKFNLEGSNIQIRTNYEN
ncbi:MAG: glycosyltransferase, partial [Nitrosopumilaceae archaeon]|nr:glycosyltransferase [Nitrosopumilaceae archaeon]